jgi:hypothetical protein
MLAIQPDSRMPTVDSKEGFMRYLQEEYNGWEEWTVKLYRPIGEAVSEETYMKLQGDLSEVVGFWAFPSGTFGDLPDLDEPVNMSNWQLKMVND